MFDQPIEQHRWLERLVGHWNVTGTCDMPDGPSTHHSTLECRSLGGLWLVGEGEGDAPDDKAGKWTTLMAVGYDPKAGHYVGTFIGSMMSHHWVYRGELDEAANRLVLNAEGPRFDGEGTAHYQDIIDWVDDDHWVFWSQVKGDDGQWTKIMQADHRRVSGGAS